MKNKFCIMVIALVVVLMTGTCLATDKLAVQINGEYVDFTDSEGNVVEPQIVNDRTMVPMRKIFEVFGADVEWDNETKGITATTEDKIIKLQINSENATVENIVENEEEEKNIKTIKLDSVPVIVDGRTLVPVRFIAESLERQVGWDANNRTVIVIDYGFVMSSIEKDAPTLYKLLTTEYKTIETYTNKTEIEGSVIYTDTEDKSNNTKLNIEGEVNIKNGGDRNYLDIDIGITGSGSLYETCKESGFTDIDYKFIVDAVSNKIYLNSDAIEEEYDKKWARMSLEESGISEIMTMLYSKSKSASEFTEIFKIDESELTIESYDYLNEQLGIILKLFGNEYFKMSGTSTHTYTLKWTSTDFMELLKQYYTEGSDQLIALEEIFKMGDFEITLKSVEKDGVVTSETLTIKLNVVDKSTSEKLAVELKAIAKLVSYNKTVSITMPKESDIIDVK